jgi:hypothetical protein
MSVAASGPDEYARHLLSAQPQRSCPTAVKFAIWGDGEMEYYATLNLRPFASLQVSPRRPLSLPGQKQAPSSFTKLEQADGAGATGQGAKLLRHTATQEQSRLSNQHDALGLFSR